ncbi:hypothetical protein, partial [Crocosphaera sp.]|uniref:hypothetical protein n=1 Tax=Crocosphaera sp. TaxID=2729996 RepID=UPI0025795163
SLWTEEDWTRHLWARIEVRCRRRFWTKQEVNLNVSYYVALYQFYVAADSLYDMGEIYKHCWFEI